MVGEQVGDVVAALASVYRLLPSTVGEGRDRESRVDAGDQVRILVGPFAGKVGTLVDLDGRGGAKVALGLLSARVDQRGLAAANATNGYSGGHGGRPAFRSSHRRMGGARAPEVRPSATPARGEASTSSTNAKPSSPSERRTDQHLTRARRRGARK